MPAGQLRVRMGAGLSSGAATTEAARIAQPLQIPPKTKPRIFLIDAYALIYRSYFAFISRPLTNAAGENTSAPFGFTRFLLDIREQFEPDYLAVVFDAGDSFRDEEYPEYKATREKMPDDLSAAFKRNKLALANYEAFNASSKKIILLWIKTAKREGTRAKRISETVRLAAKKIKAAHPEAQGK